MCFSKPRKKKTEAKKAIFCELEGIWWCEREKNLQIILKLNRKWEKIVCYVECAWKYERFPTFPIFHQHIISPAGTRVEIKNPPRKKVCVLEECVRTVENWKLSRKRRKRGRIDVGVRVLAQNIYIIFLSRVRKKFNVRRFIVNSSRFVLK